ncbi:MAG: DNA polymerase I, partial [Gemmataceae bacterium]
PEQVVDFQALVGDSVDNVPGVPGVGPKTATKWLQQYGTLENVIAHAAEVTGPKVRASLQEAIANGNLALSRDLVRLRTDVPMAMDWEGWRRREWDNPRLLQLFQEFEFRGFAHKIRGILTKSGASKSAAMLQDAGLAPAKPTRPPARKTGGFSLFDNVEGGNGDGEGDDFHFGANAAPAAEWSYDGYELVNTPTAFENFLKQLQKQIEFTFDLETTSLDPRSAKIVGLAFSWETAKAYYLPLLAPEGELKLDSSSTLEALRPIFADPAVRKANQNIKYDASVLLSNGVPLAGISGDPMLAHYLLHATARSHGLDELVRNDLQHENISISSLIGTGKKQKSMADVPTEELRKYAGEDADAARRLQQLYEPQLTERGLRTIYDSVEIPLIDVLVRMEAHGVQLDQKFLAKLSVEMAEQLGKLETEIHALAGEPFNIASPIKLREILFEKMKLPVQKRTDKTGEASTDQESLEKLAALGHDLPRRIIDHRQIAKLKSTYVDSLPLLVNAASGRVHTSFNQTIAATGRLSSSDPNLQNIPTRTEMGQQIRQAFIAPPGWKIVSADYSQIELRFLAHFCGDDALASAFRDDRDIHTRVAAQIFKVEEATVTSAQRRVAKTVNFGVIYGMSAHGLATRLSIPRGEAETFIDAYFAQFPKVLEYQDELLKQTRSRGYVSTILHRQRPFDPTAIRPRSSYHGRTQAEREAINMEIQGSAADLMKLALLAMDRRLVREQLRTKMLLTVHDEIVFECPDEELTALAAMAREEMIDALQLNVPLRVDVAAGPNWLDQTDV